MSSDAIRHYRRRAQRGFVHLLLLVFAILGVTMWGASRLHQWSQESATIVSSDTSSGLQGAKEALINYALTPPENVDPLGDMKYNAFHAAGAPQYLAPFRYFALPCPDVNFATGPDRSAYGHPNSGGYPADGAYDGYADGVCNTYVDLGNPATYPSAGTPGSIFGGLPWRDEKTLDGSDLVYQRGLGNVDFRDGYGERLFYAVSPNLADTNSRLQTDPSTGLNHYYALNPHAILTKDEGWLSIGEGGASVSERVAAVVISPGRWDDDAAARTPGGSGALNLSAYLDPLVFDSATNPALNYPLTVSFSDDNPGADLIAYVTADELIDRWAERAESDDSFIYDIPSGANEHVGAAQLLSDHLHRHGFLPEPAMFDRTVAMVTERPGGPPARDVAYSQQYLATVSINAVTFPVTSTLISGTTPPVTTTVTMTMTNFIAVNISANIDVDGIQEGMQLSYDAAVAGQTLDLAVRIADLPRVFLGDGARLAVGIGGNILPPYGMALARLDTALNTAPLDSARVATLAAGNLYPTVGIGGVNTTTGITAVFSGGAPLFPAAPVTDVRLRLGQVITVALAEPGYAYIAEHGLAGFAAFPGGVTTGINDMPVFGAKAQLPIGSRVTLRTDNVIVRLPANFSLPPGSTYDPVTGEWIIGGGSAIPVELIAGDQHWAMIEGMPNGTPVLPGDMGFFPIESEAVQEERGPVMVALGSDSYAISRLAVDMWFVAEGASRLTLAQFGSPGGGLADLAFAGATARVESFPYYIEPDTPFLVPAGSRVVYPTGSSFGTGENFAFPDGAILQLAAGAIVQASTGLSSATPDGQMLSATPGALMATLIFGGHVKLVGTKPMIENASAGDGVLGSAEKLFDIEVIGNATAGGTSLAPDAIVRPFINRRLAAPATTQYQEQIRFISESFVRAAYLTRPRREAVYYDFASATSLTLYSPDTGLRVLPPGETLLTLVQSPDNASRAIAVQGLNSNGAYGDLQSGGAAVSVINVTFDEDSWFFIPPRGVISVNVAPIMDNGVMTLAAREVILPQYTGFFDTNASPLLTRLSMANPAEELRMVVFDERVTLALVHEIAIDINVVEINTMTITTNLLTVQATVVMENNFALFPDTDMFLSTVGAGSSSVVVQGDSIVDIMRGVVHAPVGQNRIPRIGQGMGLRSNKPARVYFHEPVTLLVNVPQVALQNIQLISVVSQPGMATITVYDPANLPPVVDLNNVFSGNALQYLGGVSWDDYLGGASSPTIHSANAAAGPLVAPAGSFVEIPAGRDINFLPRRGRVQANSVPSAAEHFYFPEGAILHIPDGESTALPFVETNTYVYATATVEMVTPTATMTVFQTASTVLMESIPVTMHGPGYVNLHDYRPGGRSFAMVLDSAGFGVAPQVFLSGDAYLIETDDLAGAARSTVYTEIPGVARLDIYGNLIYRSDSGLYSELLPDEDIQFYKDFPLLYAVAPECRRRGGLGGDQPGAICAEGENEGLEFELPEGEEYVLTEPYEIRHGALITAATPGQLLTVAGTEADGTTYTCDTNALIIDSETGAVQVSGGSCSVSNHDQLAISSAGAPLDNEIRVYMYNPTPAFGDDLDGRAHAKYDGAITVHAGGYIEDPDNVDRYEDAAAQEVVQAGAAVRLGAQAELAQIGTGEKIFGQFSSASARSSGGVVRGINLADYVLVDSATYSVDVTLASELLDVDVFGGVYDAMPAGVGVTVAGSDVNVGQFLQYGSGVAEVIEVAAGESIPMQTGYLWQGYVPPGSRWEVRLGTDASRVYTSPTAVDLPEYANYAAAYEGRLVTVGGVVSTLSGEGVVPAVSVATPGPATITLRELQFPDNVLRIRVQSTISLLNSWGSGLERPDSIHRGAQNYMQRPLADANLYTPDFSQDPYGYYGAGRHVAHLSRAYPISDWYLSPLNLFGSPDQYLIADNPSVFETRATRSFAELINGDNRYSPDREATGFAATGLALPLVVAIRDLNTGERQERIALWRPIVVENGVTVAGVIRVNDGSAAPYPNSHAVAGAVSSVWINYFEQGMTLAGASSFAEQSYFLPHEFMGRISYPTGHANSEDGFLNALTFSGTPLPAVNFNVPHTDLTGTGIRYAAWPTERLVAAQTRGFSDQIAPVPFLRVATYGDSAVTVSRPPFAPIVQHTQSDYAVSALITVNAALHTLTFEREMFDGDSVSVDMHGDWMFYMDVNYHVGNNVYNSTLTQPLFVFGSAFRIRGPAAIVPPFAGNSERATRDVYGERANMIAQLFPHLPPFHLVYDHIDTHDGCRDSSECERQYVTDAWFPYVGGALTFEGAEVQFNTTAVSLTGSQDVQVMFPQPQAEVDDVYGNLVTVYAGSMLYPHRNQIRLAKPIPQGNYTLYSNNGDILAHVDVSPVHKEVNYEYRTRDAQQLDGGIFNYAPVRTGDYLIEPLGFETSGPHFDFDLRAIKRDGASPVWHETATTHITPNMMPTVGVAAITSYGPSSTVTLTGLSSPICAALPSAVAEFYAGCHGVTVTLVGTGVSITQFIDSANPYWVEFGVRNRESDDRSADWFHWGGQDAGVNVPIHGNTNAPPPGFSRRSYTFETIAVDTSFNRGGYASDAGRDLLVSYHTGNLFFNNSRYSNFATRNDGTTLALFTGLPNRNTDVPFGNPGAYWWNVAGQHDIPLGVANITATAYDNIEFATVGVRINTTADEFEALRLPHVITIPDTQPIQVNSAALNQDISESAYFPSDSGNFFTFPAGSEAVVVNNDAGSWLSANPFIGIMQAGVEVTVLDGAGGVANVETIAANNDSFRRINMSGKHVVTYWRSEPSQQRPAVSNVPLYTNVWLRLPEGGRLIDNNTVIYLPEDTIVNPIVGTYLPGGKNVGAVGSQAVVPYYAEGAAASDFSVVRPALILPAGARVVAGADGGIIRNVKAAVFFSLRPLESTLCPAGEWDAQNGVDDILVQINQITESAFSNGGAGDGLFAAESIAQTGRTAANVVGVSEAHPCFWLDDPENLDGDRLYIYRGRRRFSQGLFNTVVVGNDRTYLLGGKLELL